MIIFKDLNKNDKDWKLQYGLCVPSTCTASDISKGINAVLNNDISEEVITVTVNQENCHTKIVRELSDGDWLAVLVHLFSLY